jgi:hypothetical protein
MVAHRQGFSGLGEIDECILEPGGVFSMRRKASASEVRPAEILAKLDHLVQQIDDLKRRLPSS